MAELLDHCSRLYAACREFLLAMPVNIMYLGIIAGFFSTAQHWQKYRSDNKGVLREICRASSHLALLACFAAAVYLLAVFSLKSFAYYAAALVIGAFICKVVQFIFDFVDMLSMAAHVLFTFFSGPLVILACWLFYSGQLVSKVKNLLP